MPINIEIKVSKDGRSEVNASGTVTEIIPENEISEWGIHDPELKNAISKYFGEYPTDAFLKSPTPWGDLYRQYGWPQVQRILIPKKVEVLSNDSKPIIIKTQRLRNNSSFPSTQSVSITESVSNSTAFQWSTGGSLQVGQKIAYSVSFLGTGGTGETNVSYSQNWGVNETKTETSTLGSTSAVSVELPPGAEVYASLMASRGILKIRVFFEAYLVGFSAVNYESKYKGHHFWALNIQRIMGSSGIKNEIKSTQDITINHYSNGETVLRDLDGKNIALNVSDSKIIFNKINDIPVFIDDNESEIEITDVT